MPTNKEKSSDTNKKLLQILKDLRLVDIDNLSDLDVIEKTVFLNNINDIFQIDIKILKDIDFQNLQELEDYLSSIINPEEKIIDNGTESK